MRRLNASIVEACSRVAQAVRIMTRKSLQMSLQIFFEELRASVRLKITSHRVLFEANEINLQEQPGDILGSDSNLQLP
jgi:hypothetical protein